MRLANAREDGNAEDVRHYERQLADHQEHRLIALGDWMEAEGGRLPPQQVHRRGDLGPLDAELKRYGGTLVFVGWQGQGQAASVHFLAADVPGTLACLDALERWERDTGTQQ